MQVIKFLATLALFAGAAMAAAQPAVVRIQDLEARQQGEGGGATPPNSPRRTIPDDA
ncbi:hypothetical protein QBC34DRAFT_387814 [Podospora aff. communis PSN243]|uniref:Uncharacterized protein n=1 Tax=Podospora aff. communis PSN243 TaxID=3040156 RepID=A0AAV9G3W4_9PEZI|nr:hypothetical protein QBC34DRAFT_387814 [Podospora aff. communis PSN243]